jgi:hypothetical protein
MILIEGKNMITEKELMIKREEYEELFENFLGFMLKNNILFNVSSSIFENFPENLPESVKNNFENFMDEFPVKDGTLKEYNVKVKKLRKQILEEVKKNPDINVEDLLEIGQEFDELPFIGKVMTVGLVGLIIFLAILEPDLFANINIRNILTEDFRNAIYSRQLIMIIAHLEAFIIDSVKTICKANPQKLVKDRQIEYKKILSENINKQKLIEILADDLIEKLGCNVSLKKSIGILEKEFKIKVSTEKQLLILEEAEQIRHLYIHKGGIIDRKFIEKTGKDLKLGEKFQIRKEDLEEYYNQSIFLGTEIFEKIIKMKSKVKS